MRIRARLKLLFGLTKWYGQRKEDMFISEYFQRYDVYSRYGQFHVPFVGNILSIGENDGRTYSNVLHFIKQGWKADLIEPSPKAFKRLRNRHINNRRVRCHNQAIGTYECICTLYDSGELIDMGDTSLLSTVLPDYVALHPGMKFTPIRCRMTSFKYFLHAHSLHQNYDLISIDTEGMDMRILQQMDLKALGCKCLVVEKSETIEDFDKVLEPQGFKLRFHTQENLIYTLV